MQHGETPPPLPNTDVNYHSDLAGAERPWRTDLKPLDIVQPKGPSFKVLLVSHCTQQMIDISGGKCHARSST